MLVVFQAIVLISIFGIIGLQLLEFIGTSPIDAVFSLIAYILPFNILVTILVLSTISLLVYAVVAGAAITYTLSDYENPGSGDLSESFGNAMGRALPLIGVQLLQALVIFGLLVVFVFVFIFDPLLSLVVVIGMLYVVVRLAPASAEDRSSMAALSRSWQITGGLFWHVFLGQILMGIVFFIASFAISVIIGTGLLFLTTDVSVLVFIATMITSLLLSSVNYIFQAVLYKDLEARGTSGEYDWW